MLEKKVYRARFVTAKSEQGKPSVLEFELKAPAIYVVSVNNHNQAGGAFKSFLQLVNDNPHRFSEVIIVDATYLSRHYDHQYSNKSAETDWHKKHKRYFPVCRIKLVYSKWQDLINTENYREYRKRTSNACNKESTEYDVELLERIESLADDFSKKLNQPIEKTRRYVIEECCGISALKGVLCYPGGINEAIKYVIDKFGYDLTELNIKIKYRKEFRTPQYSTSLLYGGMFVTSSKNTGQMSVGVNDYRLLNAATDAYLHVLQSHGVGQEVIKQIAEHNIKLLAQFVTVENSEGTPSANQLLKAQ